MPGEIDQAVVDVKNELQLLGPFKLTKVNGKEVLSSDQTLVLLRVIMRHKEKLLDITRENC